MAQSPNRPQPKFASRSSGKGGPSGNAAKLRTIAAPKPPKAGSMTAMGGKLRKGDC